MKDGISAFGTKRTYRVALHLSAFDPKRTLLPLRPIADEKLNDLI